MTFGPEFIVRDLSQFLTLEPGELILTRGPPAAGLGYRPPRFLAPDDVVELAIDGVGTRRQTRVAAA
jgi:2-keto-4-pentenoate hydratase/2-oxohepta-3-ene-1,7-dioic acid hydratase in catechol pathway